jgi:hypothetical protein
MLGIFLAWGSISEKAAIFSGLGKSRPVFAECRMMGNYQLFQENYRHNLTDQGNDNLAQESLSRRESGMGEAG